MTWLLDKPFHFVSPHSLEACEQRLSDKSARQPGYFAPRSAILITLNDENDHIAFELDRDMGRGLYAKVAGHLKQDQDNDRQVVVSGKGRIPRMTFFLQLYFCCVSLLLAFVFRSVPFLAIIFGFGALMALSFMRTTFNNRNNLVQQVIQTLG
jgi:hypothetical protein